MSPRRPRGSNIFAAGALSLFAILRYAVAPAEQATSISATGFAVAGVAVAFNAGASLVFFHLASSRGALNASAASHVTTASGVVLGAVFLDETITWILLAALAVTMTGVSLVARRGTRPTGQDVRRGREQSR